MQNQTENRNIETKSVGYNLNALPFKIFIGIKTLQGSRVFIATSVVCCLQLKILQDQTIFTISLSKTQWM